MAVDYSRPLFLKKGQKSKAKAKKTKRLTRQEPTSTRIQTAVNKAVSKQLEGVVETKLIPLSKERQVVPVPIWTTALSASPTHVWGGCFGVKPSSWSSGLFSGATQYDNLGGFAMPTGPGAGQRIGDYVYMKKSVLSLNVQMEPQNDSVRPISPYRFRMIVFKPKSRVRTVGDPSDPTQDLFINEIGNNFGHGTQTTSYMDIHQSLLNKRDYTIISDKKFMLSHPQFNMPDNANTSNPLRNVAGRQYSCSKDMRITIPWEKKVRYDLTNQVPADLNVSVGFLLLGQSVDNTQASELFNVSYQGTTIYQDS